MSVSGWIGVDLDGTLAHYDGWRGLGHIGEPVGPMIDRVKGWIDDGVEVRIFTARAFLAQSEPDPVKRSQLEEEVIRPIQDWCIKHVGFPLVVTCVKDFSMVELWDDRAVQVEMNTGRRIGDGQ